MMFMDDDPDDLAAAFFAQQAAKETQKTALPTKDWIRAIHETTVTGEVDAEKWLATSLPDAQVESDDDTKGIVGIILNTDSCSLEKKNDGGKEDEYDNEIRDKIKQLLLQNIENNIHMQKLDDATDEK
mmetsp:Transcript_1017/g.1625  ORF Transcript_1017/g.1625 Transcript_1017/m.1625 type:complete len:128 (-) Transcript_1017:440-823(-)